MGVVGGVVGGMVEIGLGVFFGKKMWYCGVRVVWCWGVADNMAERDRDGWEPSRDHGIGGGIPALGR